MSGELIERLQAEIDESFIASFPAQERIRELEREVRVLQDEESSRATERQRLQMAVFQLRGEGQLSMGDANVALNKRSISLKGEWRARA